MVLSRDLKVMETAAFALSRDSDLPLRIFDMGQAGALLRVLHGENIEALIDGRNCWACRAGKPISKAYQMRGRSLPRRQLRAAGTSAPLPAFSITAHCGYIFRLPILRETAVSTTSSKIKLVSAG